MNWMRELTSFWKEVDVSPEEEDDNEDDELMRDLVIGEVEDTIYTILSLKVILSFCCFD